MRRLFIDIETSPNVGLFWRAGYKINLTPENILEERVIVCAAYKWADQKTVKALRWTPAAGGVFLGDDKQLLRDLMPVLAAADEIVGHNGDRFDMKWIRTRCLFHRIPMSHYYNTVDTLKLARQLLYLNSNRLDYISKFLGEKGKIKTDYNLWKRVVLGQKTALDEMVRYNKGDILALEAVYDELMPYIPNKSHAAVLHGGSKAQCPECESWNVYRSKKRTTAAGTVKHQMHCNDCGKYYTISDKTARDEIL